MSFADHFSSHALAYAHYRPHYSEQLAQALASMCPQREQAWDCGCGSGQLALLLTKHFAQVQATDASSAQIEHARSHPRVCYSVAPAEASALPDHSMDLIAVAQAAHWFDLPRFYAEVRRVAKPGALVALITYNLVRVEPEIDACIDQFYYQVLGSHWPAERRMVETGYAELEFPFEELPSPQLALSAEWNLLQLIGYISTWSALRSLERQHGSLPFQQFSDQLATLWGDTKLTQHLHWPLSIRWGRVAG